MPTARAIWANRAIDSSTSFPTSIMRSANSSIASTMAGSVVGGASSSPEGVLVAPPVSVPEAPARCSRTFLLY